MFKPADGSYNAPHLLHRLRTAYDSIDITGSKLTMYTTRPRTPSLHPGAPLLRGFEPQGAHGRVEPERGQRAVERPRRPAARQVADTTGDLKSPSYTLVLLSVRTLNARRRLSTAPRRGPRPRRSSSGRPATLVAGLIERKFQHKVLIPPQNLHREPPAAGRLPPRLLAGREPNRHG